MLYNTRAYTHTIPDIADDDLDPFAYRLLGYLMRRDGIVEATAEIIAEETKMTGAQLSDAIYTLWKTNYLASADDFKDDKIILHCEDKWLENIQRCTGQYNSEEQGQKSATEDASASPSRRKKGTKSSHSAMYEAIYTITGTTGSFNGKFRNAALNTGKGADAVHNIHPAMTPDEVLRWGKWYKSTVLRNSESMDMLRSVSKFQSEVHHWRSLGSPETVELKSVWERPYDEEKETAAKLAGWIRDNSSRWYEERIRDWTNENITMGHDNGYATAMAHARMRLVIPSYAWEYAGITEEQDAALETEI